MAAGHAAERPFRMDAKPNKPVYVPPARLTAAADAILNTSEPASERFKPYTTEELLEASSMLSRMDKPSPLDNRTK